MSDEAPILIPSWFVRLGAATLALFIPWATWMSYLTIHLDAQFDSSLLNNDNFFDIQRSIIDHDMRLQQIERESSI